MAPRLLIVALCLTACVDKKKSLPPPEKFYFPSGIHHIKQGTEGVLYVVSANFDRRYDTGQLTAVDLDKVGLPEFGATDASTPARLEDLHTTIDDTIQLANFGADLGVQPLDGGVTRLYIPSRAEGQKLMAVDVSGTTMTCVRTFTSDGGVRPEPVDPRDCGEVGASLVEFEKVGDGVPRADSPMSAAVSRDGTTVWVSSGRQADQPRFSTLNYSDWVVHMRTDRSPGPFVAIGDFVGLGYGSTHAVVTGQQWAYFSGRFPSVPLSPPLVRLVRCQESQPCELVLPSLEASVKIGEARGLALSTNEDRLFLAGRQATGVNGGDWLVIASIVGAASDFPKLYPSRTVGLPAEPQMVKTISRGPGRGDLVVITCSGSGSLVIYDDERGDLVAQVDGIGLQPSSFAIDLRPNGARIYVTNFTDGRVAVIDVPDLDQPQLARLVAHLGASQICLTRSLQCDGGSP